MSANEVAFSQTTQVRSLRLPAVSAAATVAAISALLGFWPLTGRWLTSMPEALVPSAIGLPFAVPPLRLFPLGETTWLYWAVDVLAAFVMIGIVLLYLNSWANRHPQSGRARAFLAGITATVAGAVIGNVIRIVFLSFDSHHNLATYIVAVTATILVTLIWGAILGILTGVVHAAIRPPPVRETEDAGRHGATP
ncbi:hypothetical protein [Rhodococcus sp. OK302]|uniref:hypothetical protein n=1 Tax=Rhodococcus sp. OK302 TaxID=1882769 RepID=UPI000B9447E6|nr:hypothetical protein [Rhodococcus sp. OK302]OYD71887.1 hypothetical protein BDB13_5571 [Rhodococcus sp. OK302]